MTLGTIRTAVRERLDDPTFDTIKIDRWANWVLQDIYSRANFSFKEGEATFSTTAGTQSYTFASIGSDVDKVSQVFDLTNEIELQYVSYKDLLSAYKDMSDDTQNKPIYWTVQGSTLKLYPIPDDTYSMQVNYVKSLSDPSDADETLAIPDRFSELVVLGTYQKALEWNDDFDYASVIERQYEQKLARMVADANKTSGQDQVINWYRPEI